MILVTAEDVQAEGAALDRVEYQVDRPADVDPVQAHRQAQQLFR